jgi:tetratricopeptide (TPR) repeat protein
MSSRADVEKYGKFASKITHVEDNKVRIAVNRVSGLLSYESLKGIMSRQLYDNVPELQSMNEGFSFFPTDPLLAESFSEHPFYIELMPESIFSQKIELLFNQVTGLVPEIAGRSLFYKWLERYSPRRLERYVTSLQEVTTQTLFSFIGVTELLFFVLMLITLTYQVASDFRNIAASKFIWTAMVILFVLFSLYLGKINLRISRLFKDRFRYEKRLYRWGARRFTVAHGMRLVRAFVFRISTLIFGYIFFLFGSGYAAILVPIWTGSFPIVPVNTVPARPNDMLSDPNLPRAYNERGIAFRTIGKLDQAIADFNEAIRLDPRFSDAYVSRGDAFRAKGDLDHAVADFNEAIRLDPSSDDAYLSRGDAFRSLRDNTRAIADYSEVIRLNPHSSIAFYNRGVAYRAEGDSDHAITDLTEAIRLNPQDPMAYRQRGDVYRARGDSDRANADYNEAVRLDSILGR